VESGERRHTRENSGIRLDAQGRWWHDGELIEHPGIVEAFNRGISPTDDGRFKLQLSHDWCFVEVEDAAYRVLATDPTADDRLSIRLSDRTSELLDPDTLRLDADGALTCRVKAGRAKAKFSHEAHFALGQHLEETPGGKLTLKVGAKRYPLPHLGK
jgi:uncharacterized protein